MGYSWNGAFGSGKYQTPGTPVTSQTFQPSRAVAAGDLLLVSVAGKFTNAASVTDTKGNTYTLDASETDGVNAWVGLFRCANCAALATTDTVTITCPSTGFLAFGGDSLGGMATASPLAGTNSGQASNTASFLTGSVTPLAPNEVAIGVPAFYDAGGVSAILEVATLGAFVRGSWLEEPTDAATTTIGLCPCHLLGTGGGTLSFAGTWTGGADTLQMPLVALYKPANYVPAAPGAPSAQPGNAAALVSWAAPADPGYPGTITGYTVTSTPGGFTATVGGSVFEALVTGLTNGTSYSFTVHATNSTGNSAESAASGAVTPEPLVPYSALQVNPSATQIRNDVTAEGGTAPVQVTDTFTADGTTFLWLLSHIPDTNAGPQSLTVAGQSIPIGSGYLLQTLAAGVVGLMANQAGVPPSGATISFTYGVTIPVLVRLENAAAIAPAAALPNWGRFSAQPLQASGLTLGGAVAAAETQLQLYETALTKTSFSVGEQDTTSVIDAGQQVQVMSSRLGELIQGVVSEVIWEGSPGVTSVRKQLVVES